MTDFQARLPEFAAGLRGTLFTPQSDGYEGARALFNRAITTRPAVLVRCLETQDVIRSVRFARENDLSVSVRAGGHHACGYCLK
jgi:FAD/FMN-containing dehydrogenase